MQLFLCTIIRAQIWKVKEVMKVKAFGSSMLLPLRRIVNLKATLNNQGGI